MALGEMHVIPSPSFGGARVRPTVNNPDQSHTPSCGRRLDSSHPWVHQAVLASCCCLLSFSLGEVCVSVAGPCSWLPFSSHNPPLPFLVFCLSSCVVGWLSDCQLDHSSQVCRIIQDGGDLRVSLMHSLLIAGPA